MIGSGKSTFAELLTSIDPEHSIHLETSELVVELANTFNASLRKYQGELSERANLAHLANKVMRDLLPQLSTMAGRDLTLMDIAIDKADAALHPDWYEKLFLYLSQAQQMPGMIAKTIDTDNKSHYRPLLQWIGGYFLYKLDNQLFWYEELLRRAHAAGAGIRLVAMTAPRQPSEAEFVQKAGGKVIKIARPGLLSDTTDVTERRAVDIKADCDIVNKASLKALQHTAQEVYVDLLRGTLKRKYMSRDKPRKSLA